MPRRGSARTTTTPSFQYSPAGPFDQWPSGIGFEYFYGFMGGETDLTAPFTARLDSRLLWPHTALLAAMTYVDGVHFCYEGGKILSMLALLGFLSAGEVRSHYFGIKGPATNIQPYHLALARSFADELARKSLQ